MTDFIPHPQLVILVAVRLAPVIVMMPSVFASRRRWTAMLGLLIVLTIAMAPTAASAKNAATIESSGLMIAFVRELIIGLSLAFGFTVLMSGLQVTAGILGRMTGLSWATSEQVDSPYPDGLAKYYGVLTAVTLVVSGGHRQFLTAFMDSFAWLPVGGSLPDVEVQLPMTRVVGEMFKLGLQAAAPIVFCLMVASTLMSVWARNGAMLNGFGMSLALNLAILLLVSWATIGGTVEALQLSWTTGIAHCLDAMNLRFQ